MKEDIFCPSCKRENKKQIPIDSLDFIPFSDEQLVKLKNKKPGFFERKIHGEILSAIEDHRLSIVKVLTDGVYGESDLEKGTDYYQYICREDGTPVEGRFYIGGNRKEIARGEGENAYIICFRNSKGKKYYEIISQQNYDRIADKLIEIEVSLYQMGMYEEKRF